MSAIDRILELMKLTGRADDPTLRAILRKLLLVPDPRLESVLLRQLMLEAGDAAYDPPVIGVPLSTDLAPAEGVPQTSWARVRTIDQGMVGLKTPLEPHHTVIIGRTGSGKSCVVAKQLEDVRIPVWIVEPEGDRVYQNVALRLGYQIIDCRRWRWNPLDGAPGCSIEEWHSDFVTNAGEALFIGEGGRALLLTVLERCRRELGQIFGLHDVNQALLQARYRFIHGGRAEGFYESLRNRLDGLLVHPMFDCDRGVDFASLLQKRVLFLCDSMSPDVYVLFVNHIFQCLRRSFATAVDRTPKHLLVVEEMHRLTNPQRLRRANITEPLALDAIRTLAKRSVCCVMVDQSPGELPPVIFGNAACRIILNLIEARDLEAVQRSLGLSWEQRNELTKLPPRTALVQYANPKHPEPFIVEIDEVHLERDVELAVADRIEATHANLRFEARTPNRPESTPAHTKRSMSPEKRPLVPKAAIDCLCEIARNPFEPVSVRDRRLKIPLAEGHVLRKKLADARLIISETVSTHGPAKKIVNSRITEKGYALLHEMKVPFEKPRGKGGWEHCWHQHTIAAWARTQGHRALVEHAHNGKSVDVSIEMNGTRIAAEVLVHGVKKELWNLRDLVDYDELWLCVADWQTAKTLEAEIRQAFGVEAPAILEQCRFRLLREFQRAEAVPLPVPG
jgi:hypothetical protein